MTVFEIRNKDEQNRLLGYLFYYEKSRRFFAEILRSLDEWDAPFMFSGHIKKGIYSIDSIWSGKFVHQRIIPPDRQNLGSILKANGLKEYDEYKLLLLSEGRCSQDELHLVRITEDKIQPEIKKILGEKVLDIMILQGRRILVFFRDGKSIIADIGALCSDDRIFGNVLANEDSFNRAQLSPGGNGIEWDEERFIPAEKLRNSGTAAAVSYDDLMSFVKTRLADTSETTKLLNCSRQYINQLCEKGRLTPVRGGTNINIYAKAELEIL